MSTAQRGVLFAFLFAIAPLPAARADSPAEEAASKARQVLRKHCGECHGTVNPRMGLSVLDRASLVELHKIVTPGKPGDSELLQLVEAGTMPPGRKTKVSAEDREVLRQWIESGAASFPREYGEDYVLQTILKDVSLLSGNPKALAARRYFSLNHYLPDAETELDRAREAFFKTLQFLSLKPTPSRPVAIDLNQTIYRVDLHQLGWDETPYKNSSFTLHDLILLEYPYATLPDESEVWKALSERYLKEAKPYLPIAYVRADWFLQVALRPPLGTDLLKGQVKPSIRLDQWSEHKPQGLLREPLIVPLDGVTHADHNRNDPSIRFDVEAINLKTMAAERVFVPGDKLIIRLTNRGTRPLYHQFVFSYMNGTKFILREREPLGPGKEYRFPGAAANPSEIEITKEALGRDQVSVFAAEERLPDGVVLHGEVGVSDRVLHGFYLPPMDGKPFDASRVVKKTIEIETRAEKK
jgi:hypothetical protein